MTAHIELSSPLTEAEIASVRREYRAASLLPKRAYHDPAIHDWEREHIVRKDWVLVGREEDAPEPGTYTLVELDGESLIVVRGQDRELRAFFNVCRHRGTAVAEEACGKVVRFQCPYHAWIYDLEGHLVRAKHTDDLEDFSFERFGLAAVRLETWQGFVFVNLDRDAAPLANQLGDLVDHWSRFDFRSLRAAKRVEYDVAANWKFVAENYSECYHCPGVHPQLNKLTPYDLGGDFDPHGGWQGGWMELVDAAETMSLDGGHGSKAGRPSMAGITELDERRIYYYVLWPTTFLSIHPDYLLVHRLVPAGSRPDVDRVRLAVRGRDDRDTRLRRVGRGRLLGPHQPPGLARLRAPAAGDQVELVGRRTVYGRRGVGPRLRPDGRRSLLRREQLVAADRPRSLRRPAAEARLGCGAGRREDRRVVGRQDRGSIEGRGPLIAAGVMGTLGRIPVGTGAQAGSARLRSWRSRPHR